MREFKFDYDYENDDLFLYNKNCKSSASVEIGDMVLDFDKRKGLVGIEIMKASHFLKALISENVRMSKKSLSNMFSCKVDAMVQDNFLFIKMILFMDQGLEVPVNLSVPRITNSSPALSAC